MASALAATSRRRSRGRSAGRVIQLGLSLVLVAVLVFAAVVTVIGALKPDASRSTVSATALATYDQALAAPLRDGGEVVQMGLKVGIGDLGGEHRTAPAVMAVQAAAWHADLLKVRAHLAKVRPPGPLRAAHARLISSIDEYLRSALLISAATKADSGARNSLLDKAAAAGQRGDAAFDQGARQIQRARQQAGLELSANLPSKV